MFNKVHNEQRRTCAPHTYIEVRFQPWRIHMGKASTCKLLIRTTTPVLYAMHALLHHAYLLYSEQGMPCCMHDQQDVHGMQHRGCHMHSQLSALVRQCKQVSSKTSSGLTAGARAVWIRGHRHAVKAANCNLTQGGPQCSKVYLRSKRQERYGKSTTCMPCCTGSIEDFETCCWVAGWLNRPSTSPDRHP